MLFHVIANLHDGFSRHIEGVGTHVGNQTNGSAADVYAFIQLLRDTHGARGGKA